MNNTPLNKTIQDIKDYVKSLDTLDNKVYQENELIIMSCFSKAMEILEGNLQIERQQMIDFHIEVMKQGLIEEGDTKWEDGFKPKITKEAEKCFSCTFKD